MIGPNDTVVNMSKIQNHRGVFTHNTRRAAKMLVVDVDHPDILDYISWKSHEEKKAQVLIAAGYESDFNGEAYKTISGQNGNNSIAVSHEFMSSIRKNNEWNLWWRLDKEKHTDESGVVNYPEIEKNCKPAKTLKAKKIWDAMVESSWKCADPGIHFNSTMNDWNTLANDGWIHSTNPCLAGDTLVYVFENDEMKKLPISEIKDSDIEVVSYDFKRGEIVKSKAKNLGITRSKARIFSLKTKNGELRLTPDHEVMTNRGWVKAIDLQKNDVVYKLRGPIIGLKDSNELRDLSEYPTRNEQSIFILENKSDILENEIIESISPLNETEDVYDFNVPIHHCFFTDQMLVSNCSEYISLNDTACNLASINVVPFYSKEEGFDTGKYKHAIRLWQFILDLTNNMAQLPSKEVSHNVYKYRNTGLGPANLGTLLMLMGLPYSSEESYSISGALMSIMTGHSYVTSAEIAGHLDQFPGYGDNRKSMIKVIKNHRRATYGLSDDMDNIEARNIIKKTGDYEGLTIKPVPLLAKNDYNKSTLGLIKESKRCWDEAISMGGSFGYRNGQVTVCAPTGCITEDSLILSSDGLLPIAEMGDIKGEEWQSTNRNVSQEGKDAFNSDKFYINGIAPTVKIQSERGHVLRATLNHKIRIINEEGNYVWKEMQDIRVGDSIATKLGGHEDILKDKEYVKLSSADFPLFSAQFQKTPYELTESIAEIIGSHQGYEEDTCIPLSILKSKTSVLCSFLRGLFDSNGEFNTNSLIFDVIVNNLTFANQVFVCLESLGIKCGLTSDEENREYKISINEVNYIKIFIEKIGFISGDKKEAIENSLGELKSDNTQEKEALEEYPDLSFVKVVYSQQEDNIETYDISVPHRNTYIANGIVSHNTIAFIMGCDSTGIEPCYALVTYKTLAGGGIMKIVNNSVYKTLKNLEYNEEDINSICSHIQEKGHVYGSDIKEEHIDIFKCAASPLGEKGTIGWEDHIRMLSSLQSFVSGGISKTINMPESTTKEDISNALVMGYELGCKGISVYRDNCKMSAPLTTDKEKIVNSEDVATRITSEVLFNELARRKNENAIDIEKVLETLGITNQDILEAKKSWGQRRRPDDVVSGLRFRIKIGQAQGYVKIFIYPDGRMCEFFLTFGNPGSSLNNMLECWSIAFSIALQRGESLSNLCSKFINVEFEPKGFTGRKDELKRVTSPVDYIARLMLLYFDDEGYIKDSSVFLKAQEKIQNPEKTKTEDLSIDKTSSFKSESRPHCPKCGAMMSSGTDSCPSCPSCGYFGGCG